jgi:hypothetical protein
LVGIIGIWLLRRGNSVGFWSAIEVAKQDNEGISAIIKILLEGVGHFGAVETWDSRDLLLNVDQLLLVGVVALLRYGQDAG